MIRKFTGDKKSIEAHSDDQGRTWFGKLFDTGRVTTFSEATTAELEALARKEGLRPS